MAFFYFRLNGRLPTNGWLRCGTLITSNLFDTVVDYLFSTVFLKNYFIFCQKGFFSDFVNFEARRHLCVNNCRCLSGNFFQLLFCSFISCTL